MYDESDKSALFGLFTLRVPPMRRSDETGRATEAVASDGLPVEPMRRTNRGAGKRVIGRYSFSVKRRVILKMTEQQERRTPAPNREPAGTSVRSGTGAPQAT